MPSKKEQSIRLPATQPIEERPKLPKPSLATLRRQYNQMRVESLAVKNHLGNINRFLDKRAPYLIGDIDGALRPTKDVVEKVIRRNGFPNCVNQEETIVLATGKEAKAAMLPNQGDVIGNAREIAETMLRHTSYANKVKEQKGYLQKQRTKDLIRGNQLLKEIKRREKALKKTDIRSID